MLHRTTLPSVTTEGELAGARAFRFFLPPQCPPSLPTRPARPAGIIQGFSKIAGEQGFKGLFRGWVPTAFGYSAQGAFKFGLYELL